MPRLEPAPSASHDLADLGLQELADGRYDSAVDLLTRSHRSAPEDAALGTALAIAYLARGRAKGADDDVVQALDLLGPESTDAAACFDRALALEALSLQRLARIEWARYLGLDPSSPWAEQARQHLAQLLARSTAEPATGVAALGPPLDASDAGRLERWWVDTGLGDWVTAVRAGDDARLATAEASLRQAGDRLQALNGDRLARDEAAALAATSGATRRSLALALDTYAAARRALERYDFAAAGPAFAALVDELHRLDPPRAWLAEAGLADCEFQLGRGESARTRALRAREAGRRSGYLDVQKRAAAILANADMASLRLERALAWAQEANELARQSRSRAAEASSHLLLGRVLGELGAAGPAWVHLVAAIRGLGEAGDDERQALTIGNASFALARDGLHHAAVDFASEMLAFDREQGSALGLVDSLRIRARHRAKAGDASGALADLREAEEHLSAVPGAEIRARLLVAMSATEGSLLWHDSPTEAVERLTQALASLRLVDYDAGIPEILLERARAQRRLGRFAEALADLEQADQLVAAQRSLIPQPLLRESYLDLFAELADERVIVAAETLDAEAAFWVADSAKGLLLRETLHLPAGGPEADGRKLAPSKALAVDTTIVAFWSLPDELLIWTWRPGRRPVLARQAVPRDELANHVDDFIRTLEGGASDTDAAADSGWLYQRLLRPVAAEIAGVERLTIVPDRVVRGLPWVALAPDQPAASLLSHFVVRVCPTASGLFANQAGGSTAITARSRLVVLADPALDSEEAGAAPPLPAARREASDVSALFDRALVLTGVDATKSRLLAGLTDSEVLHVATHFLPGAASWSTRILLAPEEGAATVLKVDEIARLQLPSLRLAVLSGCSTGREGKASLEGNFAAAGAFLAAGAGEVIASLWPVDDESTARLMRAFYRHLLAGAPADEALRAAQLDLAHGAMRADRLPSRWASFQLISLRPPPG